ncbi:hypothetical protein Efla_000511 [Eimeria flavescens]
MTRATSPPHAIRALCKTTVSGSYIPTVASNQTPVHRLQIDLNRMSILEEATPAATPATRTALSAIPPAPALAVPAAALAPLSAPSAVPSVPAPTHAACATSAGACSRPGRDRAYRRAAGSCTSTSICAAGRNAGRACTSAASTASLFAHGGVAAFYARTRCRPFFTNGADFWHRHLLPRHFLLGRGTGGPHPDTSTVDISRALAAVTVKPPITPQLKGLRW